MEPTTVPGSTPPCPASMTKIRPDKGKFPQTGTKAKKQENIQNKSKHT